MIISPVASTIGKGSTVAASIDPGSADPSEKDDSSFYLKILLKLTTEPVLQLVYLDVPGRSKSKAGEGKEDLHGEGKRVG